MSRQTWAACGVVFGSIVSVFSFGCSSKESADETSRAITWHEDIAPLVQEKCVSCHRDGGIAPFALDNYKAASSRANKMNAAIAEGIMPPWGAEETDECTPPAAFKDDLRLSDEEKAMFAKWVDAGAPEGDPKKAAALGEAPALALENPNASLTIPTGVTIEGASDIFKCFVLDTALDRDVWVTAAQIQEGNAEVVHHALAFTDPNGEADALDAADGATDGVYDCFGGPGVSDTKLLAAWAPGAVPLRTPDGLGMPLRQGTKIVLQVHYHPHQGAEVDDATKLELEFLEEAPSFVGALFLIGNFGQYDLDVAGGEGFGLLRSDDDVEGENPFTIPAGESKHIETQRFLVPGEAGFPIALWAVGTHMHYLGSDMKIAVERDEGDQCLVQTPRWDFDWQRAYFYEGELTKLPKVYAGEVLNMRCTYDNTMENEKLAESLEAEGIEAPHDVVLGDGTLDEMCLGVFGVAVPAAFGAALGL